MDSCNRIGPTGPLEIAVSQINRTERYRCGEWEGEAEDFAALRKEYGGRVSRVYVDPGPRHVGWTFTRRVLYDDAHRISDPAKRTFLRETWVTYFRDAVCACCGTVSGRWWVTIEEAKTLLAGVR